MADVNDLVVKLCDLLRKNYYLDGSTLDYDFVVEPGRKYHKIIMVSNQRSVHAFVDKKTGDLYKPASWRGPAKGVRYNLFRDMEYLEQIASVVRGMWAGGYLYR